MQVKEEGIPRMTRREDEKTSKTPRNYTARNRIGDDCIASDRVRPVDNYSMCSQARQAVLALSNVWLDSCPTAKSSVSSVASQD